MKRFFAILLSAVMAFSVNIFAADRLPAFPGAEGGGKYTTGGRGYEVYVVDTLEDYDPDTDEPIKGSFRDAINSDNRIIVFNIGGVIRLKDRLLFTNKKNITILGQTAPGNGITIYGFETNLSNSENIIIRYLRFRPGADNVSQGDSMDSIWGRAMKDIMIDHLSCSWSTDETMSLYRAENMTVQWSIIAESLTMSGHTKGRHGYGAIVGGVNTTYHHNLYANHTSRNPRFGGGTVEADDNDHIACFDFRNNIIYNWGYNTGYGGGRAELNYVYNYMKPGPGTRESVINRVIDCGEKNKPGWFYVNGNVLEGNDEISEDNSKGIYISDDNKAFTTIVDSEYQMEGTKVENLTTHSPEEAYDLVLSRAGATLPLRDGLDARIIQSVKENTGFFANRHEEVGGLPYIEETHRPDDFDKDNDGIADVWELENGLDPTDSSDSKNIAANGYANIENYSFSLTDMNYEPTNSNISITSPSNNAQFKTGENISIQSEADEDVVKVEFYNNDSVFAEDNEAPFEANFIPKESGLYNISAKAYNSKGEQTQAHMIRLIVNNETTLDNWKNTDIGTTNVKGSASLNNGVLTIMGNGKLKEDSDSCHFVYTEKTGDFDITVKTESITAVDNHAFSGIMVRNSLNEDSSAVALGLSHTKAYEWKEVNSETGKSTTYYRNPFAVYLCGRLGDGNSFDTLSENLDSVENALKSGIQLKKDIPFENNKTPCYLRLIRNGNKFTAYTSDNGSTWNYVGTKTQKLNDTVLLGVAADSNKVDNNIDNVNMVKFSHINIK